MNNWSIRARVLTLALVPLSIAVVVLSAVYINFLVEEIERSLTSRGEVIANQLAPMAERALFEEDRRAAEQLLGEVMGESDVVAATVLDRHGNVLGELARPDAGAHPRLTFSRLVYSEMGGEGREAIGRVEVALSLAATQQRQREVILTGIAISSFLLIATLLIARYIARGITYPITHLTHAVNNISDGRLDYRVGVRSGGELGALEAGINAMVSSLEEAEKENQQRYQTLFNFSGDAVFLLFEGQIVDCNAQALRLFGLGYGQLAGQRLCDFLVSATEREEELRHLLEQNAPQCLHDQIDMYEVVFRNGYDEEVVAEVCAVSTDIYKQRHLLVLARDITERKRAQEKLERQANYDAVTGLPNRILAQDRLIQAMKGARRKETAVAIMFIDVDRFKNVNDTMGHAVGDLLLIEIAQRLRSVVREADTVARLGGDEFLIVLKEVGGGDDAERVARKVIETMNEAFVLEGKEVYLGASIGITLFPDDGDDHHELLRNADAAMYKAKREGRNTYRFFTPEIGDQASHYLELESHLRRVIDKNELALHYQPQVSIEGHVLVGAEALLRWNSPVLGEVEVERFVSVAEETGVIVDIGVWVLEQVCRDIRAWREAGLPAVRVAINISSRQLKEPDFVERVERIVADHGLDPADIELEITESLLLENAAMSAAVLERLKRLGFRLALDDFGVGYSSLSYLKRYPFDALKIDRSFIRDIGHDDDAAALASAIIAIGESLGMDVVAEGVEERAHFELLHRQGAAIAQGYYISHPLGREAFARYLAEEAGSALRAAEPGLV